MWANLSTTPKKLNSQILHYKLVRTMYVTPLSNDISKLWPMFIQLAGDILYMHVYRECPRLKWPAWGWNSSPDLPMCQSREVEVWAFNIRNQQSLYRGGASVCVGRYCSSRTYNALQTTLHDASAPTSLLRQAVSWVNNVAKSEKNYIPFGLLLKTVQTSQL